MDEIQKKKILIVDDDPTWRKLYCDLLTQEGYLVDEALDGNQGFEKMQHGGYDLVMLDVVLPQMDGFEILQRLHQNPPKTPNGPVIILTNLNTDSTLMDSKEDGAVDYIVKSNVTPDVILGKIKKYLE